MFAELKMENVCLSPNLGSVQPLFLPEIFLASFSLCPPSGTLIMYIVDLKIVPRVCEAVFSILSFGLDTFYCYIFKFIDFLLLFHSAVKSI